MWVFRQPRLSCAQTRSSRVLGVLCFALLCGLPMLASAQATAAPPAVPKVDTGDTAWMLVSAAFVMLMTPGLALFYGGMVRSKNILNMLMQSFVALGVVTIVWVLWGYSLAFGPGGRWIGSLAWFGLHGVGQAPNPDYAATVPHQVYMIYQMMFAIITPALISGAIAERMKFSTYILFMVLWSTLVYCPVAHWVWGHNGWLGSLGALDFAGGTVVHITSGVSALVIVLALGKRSSAGLGHEEELRPHNLPMTLIGTGLLWFGWFGFNAGSALASGGLAGSAFLATHIAAAVAGITWIGLDCLVHKKPTALGFATGAVAGLVAITPASGFVGPLAAMAIGAAVSVISFFAIQLKHRFHYDDTLDVFGVHGIGGMWGAIATGLFASVTVNAAGANGLFSGGGFALLGKQLLAVGVSAGYAASVTFLLIHFLKAFMGLRVSAEAENAGLDLALHGEAAYNGPGSESGIFPSGS
jgi:Amt family ammonium transporter